MLTAIGIAAGLTGCGAFAATVATTSARIARAERRWRRYHRDAGRWATKSLRGTP